MSFRGETHVVTGAFGYSGRYIAARLLRKGARVLTLTGSPNRANPFGGDVEPMPYNFDRPDALEASLAGVSVLYNTYWVRFNYGEQFGHEEAVANTIELFNAAARAGVEKIVHTSISNPSLDSDLEYFRGKAELEAHLRASGLRHAILRPTVLFGPEDILINNIAWLLRRLPVFGVFGDGRYRLQPIHVDDLAALAVREAADRVHDRIIEAIGPETFTFRELVELIARTLGKRRLIIGVPSWLGYLLARLMGLIVNDVIITRPEIEGLMREKLYVPDAPPAGETRLSDWLAAHPDEVGRHYSSELARRRNREAPYEQL